ncbi:calcium-binding protein [Calothrix sp. NIES-2098]|uniref:calcium-binding protein n=1 Tax=Calothrix sp. NIES-2098 TaxID=1954171 RepID=UPI000B5EF466|nr:hemolysin-type calcium-binding region [Calothrix sp. NIES-2098]
MTIRGTASNDVLNAVNPGDELRGLDGNDTLYGSTGNERLFGGNGNDLLYGYAGDDQLDGDAGADTMDGGAGNDSYVVDNLGDIVIDSDQARINAYVNFSLASVSGGATNLTLALRASGITGTGSSGNDLMLSYASNTTLDGGAGNDILKGASGSILRGGTGNDTLEIANFGKGSLIGGAGDDRYNVYQVGTSAIPFVIDELNFGGSGTDTIFTTLDFSLTSQSGVTFKGQIENLILAAPGANLGQVAGPISGTGNSLNNVISGNRQNNILSGMSGNDSIYGSIGDDTIDGGDGNDQLFGQDGNDSLNGGLGVDTLNGGIGDDTYNVDASDTIVDGLNQGTDTVNLNDVSGTTFITSADVEYINISATGTTNVNVTVNNTINTVVTGNRGNNTIIGGAGNNILRGRAGVDTLTGGGGADIFEFGGTVNGVTLTATGSDNNSIRNDVVTDFNTSQGDKIYLSASTFTVLAGSIGSNLGAVTKGFTSTATSTGLDTKDAYFVYNSSNGNLYYNQNLTAFGHSGVFATFTSLPSLAATDFIVVA